MRVKKKYHHIWALNNQVSYSHVRFTYVQVERLFKSFTLRCDDRMQLPSFDAFVQHKFNYKVWDQQGCWSVTSQTAGSNTLYMTDGQFNRKQSIILAFVQIYVSHNYTVCNFSPAATFYTKKFSFTKS